jgi:hypothetical protein
MRQLRETLSGEVPSGYTAGRWSAGPDGWFTGDPGRAGFPVLYRKSPALSTEDNYGGVLRAVSEYCDPRGIRFDYVYSGRRGWLFTIHPAGDSQREAILRELGELLGDRRSTFLPGGLRRGNGPLHVRCGVSNGRDPHSIEGDPK